MIRGIALALPLAVVFYVLLRLIGILEKVITPVARKAGITTLLGDATITIIAILCICILVFLFGLLMQLAFIAAFRVYLQDWIIKLIPSLNQLKLIAAEQLEVDNAINLWKPVLLKNEDHFTPAFIIEETKEWITYVSVKPPSTKPDELFITKKELVQYREISMKQMIQGNKQFGKGYLTVIENSKIP
jgi:hypothetical protein